MSYYLNKGNLAEKLMILISQRGGELAEVTINHIKAFALTHEQECMGEPTFAKAVLELIEKQKTTPSDKINLILETAKITILLRNLKLGQVN